MKFSETRVFDEYTRHRLFYAAHFRYTPLEEIATANWLTVKYVRRCVNKQISKQSQLYFASPSKQIRKTRS